MREKIREKISTSLTDMVDLSDLTITDADIEELAKLLYQERPEVVQIYLNNNKIGDKGAALIGKTFEKFTKLSFIDLQFNSIDIPGADAIFKLKTTHPDLRIALFGNKITDAAEMSKIEGKYSRTV